VDGGTIPKLKSSVKKDDVVERDRKKKAVASK
jgi:hypothetical protein